MTVFSPLYTGGLFHCYLLVESICHYRSIESILPIFSVLMENPVSRQCKP